MSPKASRIAGLRRRIPRRLRQHWKIPVALIVFVTVMATAFGGWKIRPFITGDTAVITSEITDNIAGTVDLLDPSVEHDLRLTISETEVSQMLTAYEKTGDKQWVVADVTIDGTFVNDVAVRLKGNSTLLGLQGDSAGPGGFPMPPGQGNGDFPSLPEGFEFPEGFELPEGFGPPDGFDPPEGFTPPDGGMPPAWGRRRG